MLGRRTFVAPVRRDELLERLRVVALPAPPLEPQAMPAASGL